jgi:hypothetical protein
METETLLRSTAAFEISGSAYLPFLLVEVDEAEERRRGLVFADCALLLPPLPAGAPSKS